MDSSPSIEEWKPVVGFEKVYKVSNLGRVKRIKSAQSTMFGRLLKPNYNNRYPKVVLCENSIEYSFNLHKLVADAFLGPMPPDKEEIAHKDGNGHNCVASNLIYTTHVDNLLMRPQKTHCKRGHELTADNVYSGGACRKCAIARALGGTKYADYLYGKGD